MKMLATKRIEFVMSASTLVLGVGCDFAGTADMGGRTSAGGMSARGESSVGGSGNGGSTQTTRPSSTLGVGGRSQATNGTAAGGAVNAAGTTVSAGGAVNVGGAGLTGGVSTGGATTAPCYVKASVGPDVLDQLNGGSQRPTYVWSGDGFIGVASGSNSLGYRVQRLARNGAVLGAVATLWPETSVESIVRLAASGDALAIVDVGEETVSHRPVCRLAVARLPGVTAVRAPSRFSDAPSESSVLNEAQACNVAAIKDGFVATWQQNTNDTSDVSTLFAQAFDRDGNQVGERLTIASGDKSLGLHSLTSDGERAVMTSTAGKNAQTNLVFIENGAAYSTPLDARAAGAVQLVTLAPAPAGFLARTSQIASVLDPDGRLVAGPVNLETEAGVVPLDQGYVVVSHDEYLTASSLDGTLKNPSPPTAISQNRAASAVQLVAAPDASAVGLFYDDAGKTRFAKLECTDTPPSPPGPKPCPEQAEVAPKDDGCTDPVCHTIVRLDYLTLGLRGWAVVGGPINPSDAAAADIAAAAVFAKYGEHLSSPTKMSGPTAGLFTASISPGDFGAFALVGEASGLVVAAGGIVWSGTGRWWLPTTWQDPNDLVCGSIGVIPVQTHADSATCSGDDVEPPTAIQALNVVLHSNLAAYVQSQGEFSAFAYLYTPSVGVCLPESAEFVVVLTRKK